MRVVAKALILISVVAMDAGFAKGPEYDGKTLDEWTKQLQDRDRGVRIDAAQALGKIGPRAAAAVPALSGLLEDGDRSVRACAADALGLIGEADHAIPRLIKMLDDKDIVVQVFAMRALARMGIAKVPSLVELVATKYPYASLSVASTLSELGPKDRAAAVSLVTRCLQRDSVTPLDLFVAPRILGRMGSDAKAAIPLLTGLLREKKSICGVADALWQIGPEGTAAGMPILAELLRDPDEGVRSSAASALENIAAEARKKRQGESSDKREDKTKGKSCGR